jgi:spermidine synthase
MAGMLYVLVLVFAFQIIYGYVYYQIGLIITAFMAGCVAGGAVSTSLIRRKLFNAAVFGVFEILLIAYSFALPEVLGTIDSGVGKLALYQVLTYLFLLLSFAGGFLMSAEFPAASALFMRKSSHVSASVGSLYASDMAGGWLGGILGGVILLPVAGLRSTCIALGIMKLGSLAIFLSAKNRM